MKNKKELLMSEPVFAGWFGDTEQVLNSFEVSEETIEAFELTSKIIFANYDGDCCDSRADIIFYNFIEDKFYEVHGSHCSCYGLEGQWEPDEVTLRELEFRLINGQNPDILKALFGV